MNLTKKEIALNSEKNKCPCCGYYTLNKKSPGSEEICHVCLWWDKKDSFENPDNVVAPNYSSLNQGKTNYMSYGAYSTRFKKYAREPRDYEVRDIDLKNLNSMAEVYLAIKDYDKHNQITINGSADQIILILNDSIQISASYDYVLEPDGNHNHLDYNEIYRYLLEVLENQDTYCDKWKNCIEIKKESNKKPKAAKEIFNSKEKTISLISIIAIVIICSLLFVLLYMQGLYLVFVLFLILALVPIFLISVFKVFPYARLRKRKVTKQEYDLIIKFKELPIPYTYQNEIRNYEYWDTIYFDVLALLQCILFPLRKPDLLFCDQYITDLQNRIDNIKEISDERLHRLCFDSNEVIKIVSKYYGKNE